MSLTAKAAHAGRVANHRLEAERAKRDFRRAPTDLIEAFSFARNYHRGTVRTQPIQLESEIVGFLQLMQKHRPERIVEIGTSFGGTLFMLTRAAAPNARLVSVDLPHGEFGTTYRRSHGPLLRSFARERQSIRLVRGDSHDRQTVLAVASALGGPADVVFIDGDHSYDGVRADFDAYRGLAAPGAMIGFHDIVPGEPAYVGGVPEFWQQIKQGFTHTEFVEDWGQGGYGIGVIEA